MKNEVAIFLLSVQFLTRFPVPAANLIFTPERLNASARYYPMVGFIIGGLCAGTFWMLLGLMPEFLALSLSIAVGLLLTGAFHEDGLADTFDGIGGGQDRKHALAIMKDSRLGTYGTLSLGMALSIKFASLSSMPSDWIIIALILGHGVSRLSSVMAIASGHYVHIDGKTKTVAEGISTTSLTVAMMTGLIGVLAASFFLPLYALGVGLIVTGVGHLGMRLFFEPKLGGYTGDTLGAIQQASEIGFYLGLVAWLG